MSGNPLRAVVQSARKYSHQDRVWSQATAEFAKFEISRRGQEEPLVTPATSQPDPATSRPDPSITRSNPRISQYDSSFGPEYSANSRYNPATSRQTQPTSPNNSAASRLDPANYWYESSASRHPGTSRPDPATSRPNPGTSRDLPGVDQWTGQDHGACTGSCWRQTAGNFGIL